MIVMIVVIMMIVIVIVIVIVMVMVMVMLMMKGRRRGRRKWRCLWSYEMRVFVFVCVDGRMRWRHGGGVAQKAFITKQIKQHKKKTQILVM